MIWIVGLIIWLAIGFISVRYWDGRHAINMIAGDGFAKIGLMMLIIAIVLWPIRNWAVLGFAMIMEKFE